MNHEFFKYQGTGNDFILFDNRDDFFDKSRTDLIAKLCHRRFGIGADGLILLEGHPDFDFKMVYFNCDGKKSTMCGNGGRCIVHFAKLKGLIQDNARFLAIDGPHEAEIRNDQVRLKMTNVDKVDRFENAVVLDTGSPHYVTLANDISKLDVATRGADIRYLDTFKKNGINVNFIEKQSENEFLVRTYERGVEGETLSCGTGVTASALAMHYIGETEKNLIRIKTPGGELQVDFSNSKTGYENIWLTGGVELVYKGKISW